MVVQTGTALPIWGWASPGEEVIVSLAGQTKTAATGADGKWMVKLDPLNAGGETQTLTVAGTNKLTITDVLVGEVWLCSGQSNMAMLVSGAKDFEQERAAAALPQLRMFTVSGPRAATPQSDCEGRWIVCAPDTVGLFSATAFFFGREIQRIRGGAVGLVNSSVGGTLIEAWISPEAQQRSPALEDYFRQREKFIATFDRTAAVASHQQALAEWLLAVDVAKEAHLPLPPRPNDPVATHENIVDVGGLFNGKIAPLIPYALRGVVWYQGESNATAERAPFYASQLRLLVQDWRQRWSCELPFAWVQLPNVRRTESYAWIREAMRETLTLPRTGMAVTIDIGESRNLHPANKQDVGRRLAQWALGAVYGRPGAICGPLPAGHEIRGGAIVVHFQHADGGLVSKGDPLVGFVVAGDDRRWKPARAQIAGDTVIVSAPDAPEPVAVRYAWAADPRCNLYNTAGLPASPFRTDQWSLADEGVK
jgi:sialate O-acetylesterase